MPKFCVQKVDAEGNALEGAVLEITTQEDDGFTPIRFTTTKDKYYPQGLKADVTYVLSEITPPQGYSVADPVSFVLKADGSVCIDGVTATDGRQVTMVDKAVTVYVAKKDLSTKKSLKGAKLAIKNEAGETLYSFVSEKRKQQYRAVSLRFRRIRTMHITAYVSWKHRKAMDWQNRLILRSTEADSYIW